MSALIVVADFEKALKIGLFYFGLKKIAKSDKIKRTDKTEKG